MNSNPGYSVTALADPQVTGYQWRTTPLSPVNIVNDPAQNGLADWTANVSPAYSVLSTAEPTGAQAFRLSSQGIFTPLTAPAQQTLTLNQTLLASASSQLTFGSLFFDLGFSVSPSEVASVDVSADGGNTWTSVFSQSPPGTQEDTSFSPQTVSLSKFAGQQIQLRFSLTHTNGEWGDCCGEPNGWYFDNVGLSGMQAAGTPVLSAVTPAPSFTFSNSQQGPVAIDVRPQFTNPSFGSSFLSWSPATIVTTTGNTGLISLTSSANPSAGSQQVTYTATVSPTDGGGTVSFTDGGFPITGCQAEALSASGAVTCTQTYTSTSTHPIVAIYSGDASFAGSSSAALTQAVTIPPPAPATAAITNVANGATTVGFNAPAHARRVRAAASANSPTGFNVYEGTAPGKESATPVNPSRLLATATGYRVSGLENGTKYYFVVRALNPAGLGARSKEVSATPATAPAAPGSAAAHGGNRSAALTWTAPSSTGGSAITGYNVYEGTAPGGESATPVNPAPIGPKVTSYTVKGLINGTRYYFTVRAANAVASGAVSKEASATPASAPYAPSKLLAYPGKASATLSWAAPQQDGGSLITGYNVYKGTAPGGESGTPVNATPLSRTATGYTATGLANGTKYYFTVKAINAVGLSVPSREASATPTTAATAPTAPRTLTASPGVKAVALTWVAPASTGGNAITGYNVYEGTLPGGESATPVNAKPLAATATSYTVAGLANATDYYFTVKAINAVGVGAPSNEASATPEASTTFSGAPGNLKATAGTQKATLTWTAPAWNGGTAITGYNVYKGTALGGESTTPVNATPLAPTARTYTVTGLTHGTKYYFTVKAINTIGPSAPSGEASATP